MNTYDELGIKTSKMFDDLSLIVTSNLTSRINSMRLSGMAVSEIRKVLIADLIAGGRVFGQLRNGVKRISKNSIEEAGNIAAQKVFEQKGLKQYKWITVGKNICPDCRPRHGETGELEYFKTIGMPKSEFSVCGTNCNCMLVPIEYEGEDLATPIKYKKMKGTTQTFINIKQAENFLKKELNIKNVDLSQLGNITRVNAFVNKIFKLQKKHGGKIDNIVPMSSQNLTKYDNIMQFKSKTYKVYKGVDYSDNPLVINNLEYNPKFFNHFDNDVDLNNFLKKQFNSGWSLSENIDDLLTHEWGHILTNKNLYGDVTGNKLLSRGLDGVSKYATENISESIAEVFLKHSKGFPLNKEEKDLLNEWLIVSLF